MQHLLSVSASRIEWNRGRFHVPRGVGQRLVLGVTLDRNQTGAGFRVGADCAKAR